MRLLLINPKYPESFWSFKWAVDHVLPDKRAINPPLGLATLAALCPLSWEVEIVDENVCRSSFEPLVDPLVLSAQTGRQQCGVGHQRFLHGEMRGRSLRSRCTR